jgi:hypothetical protein
MQFLGQNPNSKTNNFNGPVASSILPLPHTLLVTRGGGIATAAGN